MVVMSSLAAAVQGMDEAVINGAQIIYPKEFGIGSGSCMSHAGPLISRFDIIVSTRRFTRRLGKLGTISVSSIPGNSSYPII